MNLKINLKDPKYCDGCPCEYDGGCAYMNDIGYLEMAKDKHHYYIRPTRCIEENGE